MANEEAIALLDAYYATPTLPELLAHQMRALDHWVEHPSDETAAALRLWRERVQAKVRELAADVVLR